MTPLATITGCVAPFGIRSSDGKYRIRPGAFRRATSNGRRVPVLVEHLDSLELTCMLRLWEGDLGLMARITLDRDSRNESLVSNLQDGIYSHFSWRGGEHRTTGEDGLVEIVRVDNLLEVSLVSRPHWPQARATLTNVQDYIHTCLSRHLWQEVADHRERERRQRERQAERAAMRRLQEVH